MTDFVKQKKFKSAKLCYYYDKMYTEKYKDQRILKMVSSGCFKPAWLQESHNELIERMISKCSFEKDSLNLFINFTKKTLNYFNIKGLCIALCESEEEKRKVEEIWNLNNELFDYVFIEKEFYKWIKNMKFDKIIMNPPYSNNLHLRILAKAIEKLDDNGTCVNLSPIRWLQDPLAQTKQNSDYKKFEDSVAKHIESLDVLHGQDAQNLFNTVMGSDLGIYHCFKTKDYKCYMHFNEWPFSENVLKFIIEHNPIYEGNKKDGWRVRMPVMTGAAGKAHGSGNRKKTFSSFGKLLVFKDGIFEDGRFWYDCYAKNQNFKPTPEITRSIKFNSKNEAENFIAQFKTKFGIIVTDILTGYSGIGEKSCIWMADCINPRSGLKGYLSEWTDEDFYKFFGITEEEQKLIEKTMEKYK